MKKIMFLFFGVLLIMGISFAAADGNTQMKASVLKYEPYPVSPGTSFRIWLQVENVGNEDAPAVVMVLDPKFPFRLSPSESSEIRIGKLPSHETFIKDFEFLVDADAVEGDGTFKVRISPDGQKQWQESEFTVRVRTQDATIGIDSVMTIPEKLEPGKEAIVNVKIKNMADSMLKDIQLKLDLYVEESATTSTAVDYPFAPLGATGEQFLKILRSGETAEFTFKIITFPNTESGVYKIPIVIRYKDSLGANYSMSDVTGFVVEGKPELTLSIESSEVYSDAPVGRVVLKFVNKGLGDIKFLQVMLNESDDFDIVSSSNTEYIGNLDSDDFDTAEFLISVRESGEIMIPVMVEYKDASNNDYLADYLIPLNIMTKQQAGKNGHGSSTFVIVLVLVIIIVAVLLFRRARKKRKNKAR